MDYYKILDVDKSIDTDGLKQAFKKKAVKHHPDKGGDELVFKQINEAYQILSDPDKREMYDKYGTVDPNEYQRRHQSPFGGVKFHSSNGDDIHFDDLLKNFASFGAGFAKHQRVRSNNRDIRIKISVTLLDSVSGKREDVTYKLPNGDIEVITVNIPPGVVSGDKIKFTGYGERTHQNVPMGDLFIVIEVLPDDMYQIKGRDIYRRLYVNIFDLILGSKCLLQTPDGTSININIPPGTNPGTTLSVNEHGIPGLNGAKRGKLFVEVKSEIPEYSTKEMDQIRRLQQKLKK
jgi:curved DNA-binding protein